MFLIIIDDFTEALVLESITLPLKTILWIIGSDAKSFWMLSVLFVKSIVCCCGLNPWAYTSSSYILPFVTSTLNCPLLSVSTVLIISPLFLITIVAFNGTAVFELIILPSNSTFSIFSGSLILFSIILFLTTLFLLDLSLFVFFSTILFSFILFSFVTLTFVIFSTSLVVF